MSRTASSISAPLRMRMRVWGHCSRTCRAATSPFITGIFKSRSKTSGQRSRAFCTASAPSRASPMTSKPGSRRKTIARPLRTTSWSSAMRMRIADGIWRVADGRFAWRMADGGWRMVLLSAIGHQPLAIRRRQGDEHGRAGAGAGDEFARPAERRRTVADAAQPEALPIVFAGQGHFRIEPAPVVAHGQQRLAIHNIEADPRAAGRRMPHDVVEGFLRNAIQAAFGASGQDAEITANVNGKV